MKLPNAMAVLCCAVRRDAVERGLAAEQVLSPQAILEAELAGQIDFLKDDPSLELASSDMFFRSEFKPYALVRPASSEAMVALAQAAARLDVSLRPRGAGLSYTGGYLPRAHGDIVADCSALNRVLSVDPQNLIAVVEAGCTWKTLIDALRPHRLESVIVPPVSGSHSTIGGAISQGLLAGSDSVLSMTVALPSGATVTTGSRGYSPNSKAFSQLTGPNLTGLFIGDCGRFGIKTEIALRLRQRSSHVAHLGLAFATFRQMVDVAAAIGRSELARSCIGLDRARVETAKTLSVGETVTHAGNLIRSSGLVGAFRVAIGALMPMVEGWPLYVTVEAESDAALKDKLTSLKQFARKSIHRIDTAIPRAMYAEPFSIRGAAGPKGEAWVPTHGLFPQSSAGVAADDLLDFFDKHRHTLARHSISTGVLVMAMGAQILIEPMFMWRDKLAPVTQRFIDPLRIKGFEESDGASVTREVVATLRTELREMFWRSGAAFLQQGTFYPAHDTRSGVPDLLAQLDKAVAAPGRQPDNGGW